MKVPFFPSLEGTQFSCYNSLTVSLINSEDMEKFEGVIVYHSMLFVLSVAFLCDATSCFCPFIDTLYHCWCRFLIYKAIAKRMMLQQECTVTAVHYYVHFTISCFSL